MITKEQLKTPSGGSSTSLTGALQRLNNEGYVIDFNTKSSLDKYFRTEDMCHNFKIDKIIRMDVMTDPDDQSIVYAISSLDNKTKGVLINSYGMYSDTHIDEITDCLERPIDRDRHSHDDQD
ncbi:MAG: hypothetical protein KDD37_06375 [Bdellovibrionales bacterium]|nr:hypothetical protein [Bdellovibrionales bacterium]